MKGFMHKLFIFHFRIALVLCFIVPAPVFASNDAPPPLPEPKSTDIEGMLPLFPEYSGCINPAPAVLNSAFEQRIVELVNAERASVGVPPLKLNSALSDAARYHTADLIQDNYFQHDSYDRVNSSLVWKCTWSTRINGFYTGWSSLGENIAAGTSTPEGAMGLWMNSTGHRNNILNAGYWEIGAGYYSGGGDYYNYWAQDFGRRSNVFPLIINRDEATATSASVNLYIYGSWTEMRLRSDNVSWSDWMPFSNASTWQLPAMDGEHTLTAELRTATQSTTTSDTIYLDLPEVPSLGNVQEKINFVYFIPNQKFLVETIQITPQNMTTDDIIEWEISGAADWLTLSQTQGATPQSFYVSPSVSNLESSQIYTATLSIDVTSPLEAIGEPQMIDLVFQVLDTAQQSLYLPLAIR
jgi:uncharacterized protein YkwD